MLRYMMAAGAFLLVTASNVCVLVPEACEPTLPIDELDSPRGSGETQANTVIFNMLDSIMSERASDLTQKVNRWGVFGVMASSLLAFKKADSELHDEYMRKVRSYTHLRDGRATLSHTFALALLNVLITRAHASGFDGSHMQLIGSVLSGKSVPIVSTEIDTALADLTESAKSLAQSFVFPNIVIPAYMFAISASISENDLFSHKVAEVLLSLCRLTGYIRRNPFGSVHVFGSVFDSILEARVHDLVKMDFKLFGNEIQIWNGLMAEIADEVDRFRVALETQPVKPHYRGHH